MELLCVEHLTGEGPIASNDSTIFKDMRVLHNLLHAERLYMPPGNYFGTVQNDIQPFMRKVVTTWMLELCEEQRCENQVFPLAVNFLDRFLCKCTISRRHLQLAAVVCLLLASKIRQCNSLPVDLLCVYSDYSVTPDEIRKWELLMLSKLDWCVTAVTGFDYVDHILQRVVWGENNPVIRRHAHTLVSLCYTEPEFIQTLPSLLATGSIMAAVRGLRISNHEAAVRDVCMLTRVDVEAAEKVACRIEVLLATEAAAIQQQDAQQPSTGKIGSNSSNTCNSKHIPEIDDINRKPETPTDIQDIHF